jgi:hypothetical protein
LRHNVAKHPLGADSPVRVPLLSGLGEPLKRKFGWLPKVGSAMSVLERETVHTVNDYCDGPRVGVADFKDNLIILSAFLTKLQMIGLQIFGCILWSQRHSI